MSDTPPELLLPTTESFGHNLRITNRLIQRELGARLARLGLNLGQWYALRTLWEANGITQIELAQRSGIAGPAMVAAVRGLLAMGYVSRKRPKDDKRKYVISLTEKGWATQVDALATARASNDLALSGIDPADVAVALRVMRQAHDNLVAAQEGLPILDEDDQLITQSVP